MGKSSFLFLFFKIDMSWMKSKKWSRPQKKTVQYRSNGFFSRSYRFCVLLLLYWIGLSVMHRMYVRCALRRLTAFFCTIAMPENPNEATKKAKPFVLFPRANHSNWSREKLITILRNWFQNIKHINETLAVLFVLLSHFIAKITIKHHRILFFSE